MANRRQRTTFSTSRGQKGKLAQWIRKNKNTSTYRNILKRGMAMYIHRLNKAMEKQLDKIIVDYLPEFPKHIELDLGLPKLKKANRDGWC